MSSLNKAILIGRLGKDPEVRFTKEQKPFAKFSLATSEVFTVNGERREKTAWHNIVVWGKQADIAGRYLHKGKQIYLEGKIEYREYEDPNGVKKYFTEIRCDRFVMLGSKDDSGGGGGYGGGGGGGYGGGGGGNFGGGGGGGYGGGGGSSYGGGGGGGGNSYGGGGGASGGGSEPQSYGEPIADVPQSDEFSDDDIPF